MDADLITIPVHERFLTFQGEGVHMGRKAFFIRTMGCPVHCPWCDSAGTWHKDWVPPVINRMSIEEIVAEVVACAPDTVILTGGEPMIHKHITSLSRAIRRKGYPVHVETCGGFYQDPSAFDWITVSPKRDHLPLRSMIEAADEFKLIVAAPEDIDFWRTKLDEIQGSPHVLTLKDVPVWLHPEWSQRDNPEVFNAITRTVTTFGDPFRAGYQMHKLYRADALDARTAKLAPLGGNPELGF